MMKKLYVILYAMILACSIGTVVLMILSPDKVPMHYNFAGEADRIGSKYENILWPTLAAGLGLFFLLMAKRQRKKNEPANEKILVYTGICTLAFFTALGFYFMIKAIRYDPDAAPALSYDDASRFVNVGIGALLVVIGNKIPKARRNAVIGLRTKWSMANDTVWQKSQRFAGIASVIAGFCMMLSAMFVVGIWNTLVLVGILLVFLVLCVAASRRYYRTYREEEQA